MGRQEKIIKIIDDLNQVKSILKNDVITMKYTISLESAIRHMKTELANEILKRASNA